MFSAVVCVCGIVTSMFCMAFLGMCVVRRMAIVTVFRVRGFMTSMVCGIVMIVVSAVVIVIGVRAVMIVIVVGVPVAMAFIRMFAATSRWRGSVFGASSYGHSIER